jgi:hypothetical protein
MQFEFIPITRGRCLQISINPAGRRSAVRQQSLIRTTNQSIMNSDNSCAQISSSIAESVTSLVMAKFSEKSGNLNRLRRNLVFPRNLTDQRGRISESCSINLRLNEGLKGQTSASSEDLFSESGKSNGRWMKKEIRKDETKSK